MGSSTVLLWSLTLQTPTRWLHSWYMFLRRLMTMCCVAFLEVMQWARSEVLRQSRAASISSMKQKGNCLISQQAKISASEVKVFSPPDSRFTRFQDLFTGRTENSTPSSGFIESTRLISALPPVSRWQILFSSTLISLKHLRNTSSRRPRSSTSRPFSASTSPPTSPTAAACAATSRFFSVYSSNSWKSSSASPTPTSLSKCFSFSVSNECPNFTSLVAIDSKTRSASGSLGRISDSSQQRLPFWWAPSKRNLLSFSLRKAVNLCCVLPSTSAVSSRREAGPSSLSSCGSLASACGMSSEHLESVLQMMKVNSLISRIDSCSLLSISSFSISAALSFALIFLSSSLGWGSAPFLDSLSCSSSAFRSPSNSLISDSVRLIPYWMTPSSFRLVSITSLSLSLSVSSVFLCLTFSSRASLSLAMQASASVILAARLLMRLLQLAIFFIFSSFCISSLASSRKRSQSCMSKPDSLSFACSLERFSEVVPASRLILPSLEVFSLISASSYLRKTSSRPSRLLSSFSTLRSVRSASSWRASISSFLSLREARMRRTVACFFCRKSWSSRSLPFLRGSLVMVPEESMNSPLVVMTRYLFSSQQATFMAVSSLAVTRVLPSDQMRMLRVSWSVHLQTSYSSLVSRGQAVVGRRSRVASRMESLMSSVVLPSLRLLRQSSTSRACPRLSTMKQSRCGKMVSTTSAQAASMISSSLRVTSAASPQMSFSLLAERISLMILSWLLAAFSPGFSLACRSSCCSASSFSARACSTSFSSSSADFSAARH